MMALAVALAAAGVVVVALVARSTVLGLAHMAHESAIKQAENRAQRLEVVEKNLAEMKERMHRYELKHLGNSRG